MCQGTKLKTKVTFNFISTIQQLIQITLNASKMPEERLSLRKLAFGDFRADSTVSFAYHREAMSAITATARSSCSSGTAGPSPPAARPASAPPAAGCGRPPPRRTAGSQTRNRPQC